jgi:hypothetical protein
MTSLQYQYVVYPTFGISHNIRIKFAEILTQYRNLFSWTDIKTGFIINLTKKLNEDLVNKYVNAKGLHAIISEIDSKQAAELYPPFQKQLYNYNIYFSKLYQDKFFNNEELEQVANDLLSQFYAIDFSLKNKAFSDMPSNNSDKELIKVASQISLKTLSKLDGCTV